MDIWQTEIFNKSPLFHTLADVLAGFCRFETWPSLADYNQIMPAEVSFIAQEAKTSVFEQHYEPRIFLRHEVQTRQDNWHDFFNHCVWKTFPKTKASMNAQQYFAMHNRDLNQTKRTPLENVLTLFDENGAIVISSDRKLLELLREFAWHALFIQARQLVKTCLDVHILGHALYEKALQPYIGMTASSVLIQVAPEFLTQSHQDQIHQLDSALANTIDAGKFVTSKQLQPLPVLGIPGWDERNQAAVFYDNEDYFRKKPAHKNAPIFTLSAGMLAPTSD